MKDLRLLAGVAGLPVLWLAALFAIAPAHAQDALKIAIGQINNWENQPPTLGQDLSLIHI